MSLEYPFPLNHAWPKDVLLLAGRQNAQCGIICQLLLCDSYHSGGLR